MLCLAAVIQRGAPGRELTWGLSKGLARGGLDAMPYARMHTCKCVAVQVRVVVCHFVRSVLACAGTGQAGTLYLLKRGEPV